MKFPQTLAARRRAYRAILLAGDAVLTYAALRAAYYVRFSAGWSAGLLPPPETMPDRSFYASLEWTATAAWVAAYLWAGFYKRLNLSGLDEFVRAARGVAAGWVAVLAGTFLFHGVQISRLTMALSALFAFLLVFSFRQGMKFAHRRWIVRWWEPHAVLVMGEGRMAKSILQVLSQHPEIDVRAENVGSLERLKEILDEGAVREVYVGRPNFDHALLIRMAELSGDRGVPFRIVPDVLELRMGEVVLDESLGFPTYQILPATLHGWTYFYKRFFDVAVCLCVLAAGILPLLFIVFLIKIDSPGPILFKQTRVGRRGRPFPFFKFRSMVMDADAMIDSLRDKNERSGPVFKMKDDPRVTRTGKWLRRFSIDEIPQLLNVLRGEMSLIGPRPQLPREVAVLDDEWAKKRMNVLPGMTGLWQVSGRASLSFEEMVDLDIYYIEHWSPGLDLKILLKTVPTVLGASGAY